MLLLILCEMTCHGQLKKEMHEKEATRDMATYALAVDDFGLSNQIVTCGMVCPCAFATVME